MNADDRDYEDPAETAEWERAKKAAVTPFERADLEHEIVLQAIVWHGQNRDRRVGMDRTSAALYDTVTDLLNALNVTPGGVR